MQLKYEKRYLVKHISLFCVLCASYGLKKPRVIVTFLKGGGDICGNFVTYFFAHFHRTDLEGTLGSARVFILEGTGGPLEGAGGPAVLPGKGKTSKR